MHLTKDNLLTYSPPLYHTSRQEPRQPPPLPSRVISPAPVRRDESGSDVIHDDVMAVIFSGAAGWVAVARTRVPLPRVGRPDRRISASTDTTGGPAPISRTLITGNAAAAAAAGPTTDQPSFVLSVPHRGGPTSFGPHGRERAQDPFLSCSYVYTCCYSDN